MSAQLVQGLHTLGRFVFFAALHFAFTASASATIRAVPGTHPTIQSAINAASPGDTVLVAAGTYTGAGNKDVEFFGKELVLLSESGAEATIIDCEGSGRGIDFRGAEGPGTVVDGFTFTNGHSDCCWPDGYGGGIACRGGAAPLIRNCIFRDNYAERDGGALFFGTTTVTIENCRFEGNVATFGGAIFCGPSSTIRDCEFIGNEALSAGGGGAITSFGAGSPVIERCVFRDNTANRGGAFDVRNGSSPSIDECLFSGNRAGVNGGAIHILDGSMDIVSSTLSGNRSLGHGGALYIEDGSAALDRTIVWGDCAAGNGDEVYVSDAVSSMSTVCCDVDSAGIEAAPGGQVLYGTDMLYEDPVFCEPVSCFSAPTDLGDYSLQETSPCLVGPCGELIGAIAEICGAASTPPPLGGPASSLLLAAPVPNPVDRFADIRFDLATGGRVHIDLVDSSGRILATIARRHFPAGPTLLRWEPGDMRPADGVYFLRLRSEAELATRRLVLLSQR